jgi:subtilisin family serine protease
MDPLKQIKLHSLMDLSEGNPEVVIGIIDGPVDFSHPAFEGSKIKTVNDTQLAVCKNANSIACMHGTFIMGMLGAQRGGSALSICPKCQIILRPIFPEVSSQYKTDTNELFPSSTPEELATAIIETIDKGARILNLSLGLSTSSLIVYPKLREAYDYALQKGVIIVVAAGNQGNIGNISLINHQWIIPVAACNEKGQFDPMSNYGPSIGHKGLMAPGININSTSYGGKYIALLWSLFPKTTASHIMHALMSQKMYHRRRLIIPQLLDAEAAWRLLQNYH